MIKGSAAWIKFISNPLNKVLMSAGYGETFEIIPGFRLRVLSDPSDSNLKVRVLSNQN